MYRVYGCLVQDHDLRLVLVAALICLLSSWTALGLVRRSMNSRERARRAWLAVAAMVAGCGIWSTHFVAMLAFATGLPTGYDPWLTALSVLVAVLVSGCGFAIAIGGGGGGRRLLIGGAVVGSGIGLMHFTGMEALLVPAYKTWDVGMAASAAILGIGFGAASVRTALGGTGWRREVAGTALMVLAICSMHFTAMSAFRLVPTPLLPVPDPQLSPWWLALGVAGAAAAILSSAVAGLMVDSHLASRTEREASRLRALVDATFEGILIHADGIILDANASLAGLVGQTREGLLGRPVLDLLAPGWSEEVWLFLTSTEMVAQEAEMADADGHPVPIELLARRIDHHGRPAQVVAVRDTSERRRADARIRHLAHHDALTDLPNRVLFREHLHRMLARARREGGLAVLCLDLDRFKAVNDTLGHPAGDALLRAAAERLRTCTREADVVARLGGDEFAIIQECASQPVDAITLARRVIETLSTPFEVEGHQVAIGVSIGIALTGDGPDADMLLKCADLALYRAKAEGRGTWAFFEAEMDARMQARRLLELELRRALPLNQFHVFYQPLLEASGGAVTGFEALLRWKHPERGMVSPAEFIPLSEEIGLIGEIGAWALRRACMDAASWPGEPNVAVNLSPAQFRNRNLAKEVAQALAEAKLAPSRLELEVTESLLLGDDKEVLAILHELRNLGVRIAMDDFGTGYSSLSYLRRFPFDKIKIDQSFVQGLGGSGVAEEDGTASCAAIVRAVIALGRSLGMAVNAEGVETEDQLAALCLEGCGEVQGYLFSKPRPAAEVPALLLQRQWCADERATASRAQHLVPAVELRPA